MDNNVNNQFKCPITTHNQQTSVGDVFFFLQNLLLGYNFVNKRFQQLIISHMVECLVVLCCFNIR